MTVHALERIAQRFPCGDPELVLLEIKESLFDGTAHFVTDTKEAAKIWCTFCRTAGRFIFSVWSGSEVMTVLREGMDVSAPSGSIKMMIPAVDPGIHIGMDDALYHGDPSEVPSLSSTLARKLLNQSPLHAWTDNPRLNSAWEASDGKATFDFGRAAHLMTLGQGGRFEVYPEDLLGKNGAVSTTAAKEWAIERRLRGVTPIKAEAEAQVLLMGEKIDGTLKELKIELDPDRSEIAAFADIEGVSCRAMIDNAPEEKHQPLYDFKTCVDASPNACMKSVMNYGYDVQASHYLETWKAATGETRSFRFIFQEKTAPFEVCVIELSEDSLIMGRKRIKRAREIWRQCINSGHWPGYARGVHTIDLPEFYQERWLERESREADFRNRTGQDILDYARKWQSPEGLLGAAE